MTDILTRLAAKLYDIPVEEVSRDQRFHVKEITFYMRWSVDHTQWHEFLSRNGLSPDGEEIST